MSLIFSSVGDGQAFVSAYQAALGDEIFEDQRGEKPFPHRKIEDLYAANSRIGEEGQSGGLCGMTLLKLLMFSILYLSNIILPELILPWISCLNALMATFCKFSSFVHHSYG